MKIVQASLDAVQYQFKKMRRYGLDYPAYISAIPVKIRIDE